VISMANALTKLGKEFQPLVPPRGSVAASVQAAVPQCLVAAAFHHVPAKELGDLRQPIESDVLICSDHVSAVETTSEIVAKVPNMRPLNAGELAMATPIESFTAGMLQLNMHYRTRVARRAGRRCSRAAPGGRRRPRREREGSGRRRRARGRADGVTTDDRTAAPPMRLFDTARREIVPFAPGPIVTMYTCGITPYDATHIGHAAVYLTYDVLQRRLRDRGHETRCVRNVTDVDDDILRKARELGVHYLDLAAAETARFDDDMRALDVIPAWSEPRATSAIPDIRGFIGMVLDRGYAYQAGGGVYFDVSRFERFGQLSHLDRDQMLALAAERGGNIDDPNKRDPLDFVLWQPSGDDEPAWESLWGPGRPGWHIECSALAMRELGTTIDLHGGGTDLIFPHHECEAAQSEAATGERFVRHWMHQALVRMDGEKMSKSLGNLVFVSDLRKMWDTRAIRLAVVAHHYRHPWDWTDDVMEHAAATVARWDEAAARARRGGESTLAAVRAALDDDLDTPTAGRVIVEAAGAGDGITAAAALLGLDLARRDVPVA
jgi:L-cysteine:1D-myo-inositol 2-amino-2-deoxy-alpha-D-glucopyranoside ligase